MKMLKVVGLLVVMAMMAIVPLSAQNVTNEIHTEPGTVQAIAGIGYAWGGLEVSGGAEYSIQKFNLFPRVPLSVGIMGMAAMDIGTGFDFSATIMPTLHWGLKAYRDLPNALRNFDWYTGFGIGMGFTPFAFGISTGGGLSYYINDKIAIDLHSYYIRYFVTPGHSYSGTFGIRYRLK